MVKLVEGLNGLRRLRTRVEKMKMKTKIKNVGQMNNSNCLTSQPLNTSTSDGVAIRVEKG